MNNYILLFPTFNQLSYVFNDVYHELWKLPSISLQKNQYIRTDYGTFWFAVQEFAKVKLLGMEYKGALAYRESLSLDLSSMLSSRFRIRYTIANEPEEVVAWVVNILKQNAKSAH